MSTFLGTMAGLSRPDDKPLKENNKNIADSGNQQDAPTLWLASSYLPAELKEKINREELEKNLGEFMEALDTQTRSVLSLSANLINVYAIFKTGHTYRENDLKKQEAIMDSLSRSSTIPAPALVSIAKMMTFVSFYSGPGDEVTGFEQSCTNPLEEKK